MTHRRLGHVGQHRIGPPKGDQGHLAEEPPHGHQGAIPSIDQAKGQQGQAKGAAPHQQGEGEVALGKPGVGRCGRGIAVDEIADRILPGRVLDCDDRGLGLGQRQPSGLPAAGRPSGQGRQGNHQGIGPLQHAEGQKGDNSEPNQGLGVQGAAPQPPARLHHDRQHRGLERPKHGGQERQLAPQHIDARQGDQHDHRRQQKQAAGHQATPHPMHQPAQVGGQLNGLGARQHHAVVEGVEIAPLREPPAPLHQLLVHQGDLPCRPAKTDPAQLKPIARGLGEGDTPHH